MHCLWSKWAPPSERSRLATLALSGSYVGSVLAFSLGGLIDRYINWHSIFYIFGTVGVIWSLLWFYHISESPASHHKITEAEKLYIESSLPLPIDVNVKIPWLKIFCSTSVWAIIAAHFAENWGFYTFLTEMPTFYSEMLNYKIEQVGFLTSLPYILMAIVLYSSGLISDLLIARKLSTTLVRKIFCCTGLVLQSIFMFMLTLSDNSNVIIGCTIMSIGLGGMPWAAFGVNHLDVGAGYANVLMALSNTVASIPGIISPVLTGHIIENKTKLEWNYVFLLASFIFFLGAIIYFILGSGETREWAISSKDPQVSINTSDLNIHDNKVFVDEKAQIISPNTARYDNSTNKVIIDNIKPNKLAN
jgi:ACS family sodium-dependent inorganic phosphate cotransporter